MTLAIMFLGTALLISSNDILLHEFGIYDDQMPTPSAALSIRTRKIYTRHKTDGELPPLSQRNNSGPIRAENSQFNRRSFGSGSTLRPRAGFSAPKAPSRFSRPSIFR